MAGADDTDARSARERSLTPPSMNPAHRLILRAAPWLAMSPMIAIALIELSICARKVVRHSPDAGADLNVYLRGASAVSQGLLYAPAVGQWSYNYPASSLFFLGPLHWIPMVEWAWLVASGAMVAVSAWLVLRSANPVAQPWSVILIAGLTVVSWPATDALLLGQVAPLIVILVVVDELALSRTRAHGLLVGLAAAVKLTPLIFIPWLWVSGRRRAALTATSAFGLLTLASMILWPSQAPHFLSSIAGQDISYSPSNVSVWASAHRFGAPAWLGLVLTALVLTVVLTVAARAQSSAPVSSFLVVGCASAAAAPIGWEHGWIWLPLLVVALWFERPRWHWLGVLAVWVITVSCLFVPSSDPSWVRVFDLSYLAVLLLATTALAWRTGRVAQPTAVAKAPRDFSVADG